MGVVKHRTWASGVFLPFTEAAEPALTWGGTTAELPEQIVVAGDTALRGSAPAVAAAADTTAKADAEAEDTNANRLDAQAAPGARAEVDIAQGTDAMPSPAPALAFAASFEGLSLPAPLARAAAAVLPSVQTLTDAPTNSADLVVPEGATSTAFTQVNEDGFGDAQNVYAWAMYSFNGLLYVTTLDLDGTQDASTGITGAGSVYRYDGTTWETISEDGLGNADNDGFRCLNQYDGFLYAGSLNDSTGAELYRTADGVNWELVVSGGFGNATNAAIRDLVTFTASFMSASRRGRPSRGTSGSPMTG